MTAGLYPAPFRDYGGALPHFRESLPGFGLRRMSGKAKGFQVHFNRTAQNIEVDYDPLTG